MLPITPRPYGRKCLTRYCLDNSFTDLLQHVILISKFLSLPWCGLTGSNRRPPRCKRDALPAELSPHKLLRSCPTILLDARPQQESPSLYAPHSGIKTRYIIAYLCSTDLSYSPMPGEVGFEPTTLSSLIALRSLLFVSLWRSHRELNPGIQIDNLM